MIEMEHIYKAYGTNIIFENQSLILENNRIYALTGVNGIGKSTLLNLITQPFLLTKGKIKIDGICSESFESKYHYAYVPDKKDMFLELTGREYLTMLGHLYKTNGKKVEKERALIQKFRIEEYLDMTISGASLGTRQKIYLTGALLSDAGNLILDEPFNGLDLAGAAVLKEILTESRNQGKTILFSSHCLDWKSDFCDRVVFIDQNHEISVYEKQSFARLNPLCYTENGI